MFIFKNGNDVNSFCSQLKYMNATVIITCSNNSITFDYKPFTQTILNYPHSLSTSVANANVSYGQMFDIVSIKEPIKINSFDIQVNIKANINVKIYKKKYIGL